MAFGFKRRVWIGLLVGAAAVGSWAWWTRSHLSAPETVRPSSQPFIQLASAGSSQADEILRERAELLDPTPLFFPTQWNYGQQPLRASRQRQPGQVFGSFEPKLPISEKGVALYRGEASPVPEKLSDVLVQGNEAPFGGMGQIDRPLATLPVRSGFIEVRDLKSGNSVIYQQLNGIVPPRSDFAPIEFLVVVDSAGLIGSPFVLSGSEWDEVDAYFQNYLVRTYRLGERLRPGRYRVSVGA
jgi:hypothetical protein